ncbi:MAG: M13 family metallopeptidase [Neisseriaceae bacterium]
MAQNIKHRIVVLSFPLLLAGCSERLLQLHNTLSQHAAAINQAIQHAQLPMKGIKVENMDLSVRPQDDFFKYVNGNWLKHAQIPADKPSWGAFNELRDLTDENCLSLLRELVTQQVASGTEAQKIKTTYLALLDTNSRNQAGLTPLDAYFKQIDEIHSLSELKQLIAKLGSEGIANPFYDWSVEANLKDSKHYAVYLNGGAIGLPRDYYQKRSPHNTEVIRQYQKFVTKILSRLNYKNPEKLAVQLVELENKISSNLLTNEQSRNALLQYNPRSMSQLVQISKNVNLPQFLHEVRVTTPTVIIGELNYFKHLDAYFNENSLELLKVYYKYYLVTLYSDALDQETERDFFLFFKQFLQGQKEQQKLEKRALGYINDNLGEAFGKLYVKKYFPESSKHKMLELISYLVRSYHQHLEKLAWMSETTRKKALTKLDRLNVKVGYPDHWKDFSQLKIAADEKSLFNIKTASFVWNYNRSLQKVGQKVDRSEWGMPPQIVNAYYEPTQHEIVFPAAILQPPFFDQNADPAINFGGIGGVIAHEITHGFDDSGAMFDANGNLNNWWSKEDKKKFDQLTQKMVEQFNAYEVLPGHFINGKFTLGENIADLGGVNLAFDALQLYLKDKKLPILSTPKLGGLNFNENQKFFISWANIWRVKATEEYLKNQIRVDPHSPGRFRAFAPLTNVDAFYEAFNIKPGDKLYKAPEQRIKIW